MSAVPDAQNSSSPYLAMRRRLSGRDRGLREKVMSLSAAVATISDHDHVAIGGNTFSRTPFALIWELVRQQKRHLTVSRSITSTEGDFLLAGGCVDKYMTSWFSQGIIWGLSRVMRDYVENGKVTYEEWSHMSLGMMYRAGAMGLPFMPTRVMMGSSMPAALVTHLETMRCPYTGDELLLLPALNPNVALIHVQRADVYGNAQYDGLPFMDADIAMAADRVILTTEKIVSNDEIRAAPDHTRIPFLAVDAVVECPFGAAPHECAGLYDANYKHMNEYSDRQRTGGVEGALGYMREHIFEPKDWRSFVDKIGVSGRA
ncbi:CoA transferase subunit A [Pseudaminobacter sp. 19-2017]|uniref:CoA transferase subunit A n=1 Tax=Pseudaminobacter soli (ex Zhang et al. 2022) TaxID=2831468 RepID=A0A942E5K7_9HYPH|nr:CoA transferase subunit A [Pseudaminobacter soli]MBS3651625.1 CoA transferase subunit A [Pseudaminobacter soli]